MQQTRSWPARSGAAFAAAVCAALTLAACGGSQPPSSSTSASGSSSQNDGQAAYKYAACMRTHGVSSFPDPKVTTTANSVKVAMMVPASVGNSPAFKTASKACANILPAPQTAAQRSAEQ